MWRYSTQICNYPIRSPLIACEIKSLALYGCAIMVTWTDFGYDDAYSYLSLRFSGISSLFGLTMRVLARIYSNPGSTKLDSYVTEAYQKDTIGIM